MFVLRTSSRAKDASREGVGEVDESLIEQSKEVETRAGMEAVDLLSMAISAEDEKKAEAAKQAGNALFAMRDYRGALECYTTAVELNPAEASYRSNRSACHLKLKDYLSAIHDATIATKLQPAWVKGYYRLSMARLAVGRYEDAAAAAWEGLCVDPESEDLARAFEKCAREGKRAYEEKVRRR